MAPPEQPALIAELWRMGRCETSRAHHSNFLADLLDQLVFPVVSRLDTAVERLIGPRGMRSPEDIARLLGDPSIHDLLDGLPDALANVQDAHAAWRLLESWQPMIPGPASAARVRQHQPADAWSEETAQRSIDTARGCIDTARARLKKYVDALRELSQHYRACSARSRAEPGSELQAAFRETAGAVAGLADALVAYARAWGVHPW